jgi:hypothetical protein
MAAPDIFIITSVINTGNHPWSYTNQRSCYSPEKRFEQTLQTIKSIRDLSDNSKILLVECSDLEPHMAEIIRQQVDYFIQTYNDTEVRRACLNSEKKGFGEIKKLQCACKYIRENGIEFRRIFKISGRYFLNSSFDKKQYVDDAFTFKMFRPDSGSTVLYSVPFSAFDTYCNKLQECSDFYDNNPPTGIETLIPCICNPRHNIHTLGVSGHVAVLNNNGESEFYTA